MLANAYTSFGLALNIQKTELLLFKNQHSTVHRPQVLPLASFSIDLSSSATCLGITLCETLGWQLHFSKIRQKCYASIAALSRLRKAGFPLDALLLCYHGLFVPIVTYGILVWGSAFRSQLRPMHIIQRDAIRAVFGLPRHASVAKLMQQHKILGLHQLYTVRVACAVYKQLSSADRPSTTPNLQHRQPIGYPVRSYHPTEVISILERREYCVRTPSSQHTIIWNSLPIDIRTSPHLKKFRERICEYVLANVQPF